MAAEGPASADADLAFEALVRAEARAIFALAVSILRDTEEAEDAVQDTLERAWRSWKGLRDPARRSAWLRQICVRRCLRIRHSLLRRWLLGRAADTEHSRTNEEPDFALDHAYGLLSPRQRAVITLHYHHGYALDECASLMRCRPGTVRSHLARALARLRQELADA